ncbi:uncharacterized protein LOC124354898 isoform X2 [Homalodisca vitripennis]|nr:uncharacterized protein LOC124354898 isoform X2 [Homalodisca vitripennis]
MEGNDLPDSCRLQAFKIVISHFSDTDFLIEALASCLCWNNNRLLEVVQLVSALGEAAVASKHGLHVSLSCLALATLVPRLLQTAVCPQPTLQLVARLAAIATNTHSTLLALLADSIPSCPAPHLQHLLAFFVELLGRGQCSLDCTWMCVSALMPWLAASPSHLHQALHTASLIVNHASAATANASTTATLIGNSAVAAVVSADPRLTQAIHLARLSEILRTDSSATLQWLKSAQVIRMDQIHQYVSALLISRAETEVKLAALEALVCSQAPMATSHNLTLMLYQLAKEKQPKVQLALLRALPSTAVEKNNVLGVISTLEALRQSGNQQLSLLAVELYCQLWLNQERCYPQLMGVLDQNCENYPWLANLLQANICKIICDTRPEMHGKEVVPKVSDILNKCGGVKDSAASALALEALIPLCCHDVVDIFTIWRSLAPRFSKDKRPPVIKSLCELLSVAANQKSGDCDSDSLVQIIKWLWNLVAYSKQPSIVDDALKALSKFRLEQMTLKMLPECFRKDITLPPEMAKTPVDAARRPEDVLDYIPGECWIQLLRHVGTESASLAIACWIRMELATFRSNRYQVDRQEPRNYKDLPARSVVRGVVTSLQHLSAPTDSSLANLCVVALIQPSPKPLPSLSWAFLSDLPQADPALAHNIVRLAAKQSQISPSARKITDSYISSCGTDREKIEFLYTILSDLCRGIPPNTLKPFLERTLQTALNQKDNEHLSTMLGCVKATLKEEKIHEANRALLHQQVKALWDMIEPQHEIMSELMSCLSELPISTVESVSSTSVMWEVTSAQLQKAFRLRAFMALSPNTTQPLNWLNEIIEVASSNISEQALALQLVCEVITQLSGHSGAWPWLQELMGQTHLTTVNNKGGVEFLVSVFVLCVDIMSGYSSLETAGQDSRAPRLPQAVVSLVNQHGDVKSMLEWLNHMKGTESFPSQYLPQFQMAARNLSLITT